ncbi:MAG: RNA methyltransferase [Armatimonadota bacterium]
MVGAVLFFVTVRAGSQSPQYIVKGYKKSCRKPESKIVASAQSASIVALSRLVRTREERSRTGLFYVEGMRFVSNAVKAGFQVEKLIVAPDYLTHPFGQRLAETLRERGTPCITVSGPLYQSMSRVEEPQGIAAVVRQRWEKLEDIQPEVGHPWVAVDTLRSPGNLGTILRTADAVGAAGILCVGPDIDPYEPAVVRATMGALFALRLVRTDEHSLIEWKRRTGLRLIGTSPAARADYQEVDYTRKPVALWLGGERQGMTEIQKHLCDSVVRIPMVGRSDSLNVAIAAGVLLYEAFNQNRKRAT